MNFNMSEVLTDMKNAAVNVVKDDIKIIPYYLEHLFENQKEDLEILADAKINRKISDEEFQHELEREKEVVETEMLTLKIIAKADAQKAINAAADIFQKAVETAIRGAL